MLSTSHPFRDTLFFEQTMKKNVSIEKRKTFRHGDLRNALMAAGLEMARGGGANAVILREATRQARCSATFGSNGGGECGVARTAYR